MLNDMIETLNGFRTNISDEELNRAKNILKRSIMLNLENQSDRLEETARNVLKLLNLLIFSWMYMEN